MMKVTLRQTKTKDDVMKSEHMSKRDWFYDIESLHNIFTVALYNPESGQFKIVIHTDDDFDVWHHQQDIIDYIYRINQFQFKYDKINKSSISIITLDELISSLLHDYYNDSDNPTRLFGWNSQSYDAPLLSYIIYKYKEALKSQMKAELEKELEEELEAKLESESRSELKAELRAKQIDEEEALRELDAIDIKDYFENCKEPCITASVIREFSDDLVSKKTLKDAFGSTRLKTQSFYYELKNKHIFIDVQKLNEGMSYESLKRVSAQLGLMILESDKLAGDNAKVESLEDIKELTAYNYVDVFNMYMIFAHPSYFSPFGQKSGITTRFNKEFQNQLGPDTTSAKLIEHIIAPVENNNIFDTTNKLEDDPYVDFLYPTSHPYKDLKQWCIEQLKQKIEDENKNSKGAFEIDDLDSGHLRELNQDLMHEINKRQRENDQPEFPVDTNTKDAHQRFEFKLSGGDEVDGDVFEDLLEMARDVYDLPDGVYDFYSHIRGSDVRNGMDDIKSRLSDVDDKLENNHLRISDIENIDDYKYNDNIFYTDRANITVPVRNSNTYLTFSTGGIHGEYFDSDAFWNTFEQEVEKSKKNQAFNDDLEAIQNVFGKNDIDAQAFRDTKQEGNLKEEVENRTNDTKLIDKIIQLDGGQYQFATYSKANGYKWKNKKKIKSIIEITQGSGKGSTSKSQLKSFAKTVDATNVGHNDIASMYPSLLQALSVFKRQVNGETIDDYSKLLDERLEMKAARSNYEYGSKEYQELDQRQTENKLTLNAASGQADGKYDNKIRVNNKMTGARLKGQLILAYLVYKITDQGGLCISSNTDGVYYTGISNDEVSEINEEWCHYFQMGATPEHIDHFISKNSNNRVEIPNAEEKGSEIVASGADVLAFKGENVDKKATKPNIIDWMLVYYFRYHEYPLRKFDKNWIKNTLETIINKVDESKNPTNVQQLFGYFQWVMKDGLGSNQYFLPININKDETEVATKSHTKRIFLVKESDYGIAKYAVNKQLKHEDKEIRNLLEHLGYITEDTKGNANKKKASYLSIDPQDNPVRVEQGHLGQIDMSLLDELDLDKYIDIAEQVWHTWSDNYIEIYQPEYQRD